MRFRHSVTVKRPVDPTASASGEKTVSSWTTVATGVAADIQPRSGSFRQQEYGTDTPSLYRAFFRPGADVRARDQIVSGSTTYLVTFVAAVGGHHLEADLSQLS